MGNHKVLRSAGSNLRYSMYEFIDAVHKRSIIWERSHPNFHNRELRDEAWQQIGHELCSNFDDSSEPEKQEIVKTLLKRWKNTRDSYLRVNRLRQSGEEVARASYIYEKELSFLLNVKAESEDDVESLKEQPKPQAKRKRVSTAAQRSAKTPRKRNSDQESNIEPAIRNPAIPSNINTVLGDLGCAKEDTATPEIAYIPQLPSDPPCSTNTAYLSADPDQAFFDTIKPHMQQMCADRKLDFQIEVLKILRNFKPN
uniref:Hinge2 n=1 Tax=Drosophila melanogaster TaxID=7227 RepID=Q9VHL0_DROME|eukprot:NP_649837.1 hinge2 [Drosophila melanogaster]